MSHRYLLTLQVAEHEAPWGEAAANERARYQTLMAAALNPAVDEDARRRAQTEAASIMERLTR
jgi:hypothetical protein